ncbi:hypothetical protein ABZP36_004634 [Zizania latifolia]
MDKLESRSRKERTRAGHGGEEQPHGQNSAHLAVPAVALVLLSTRTAAGGEEDQEGADVRISAVALEPHLRCSHRSGAATATLTTSPSIDVSPSQLGVAPMRPPPLQTTASDHEDP